MAKIYNWKEEIKEDELQEVINVLNNDGLIVFPTDTVYGLACNCFSENAINKIFEVKHRAKNNPINSTEINPLKYIFLIKVFIVKVSKVINIP